MSNPYIGEIRMFGGNFAPAGWAFCQGQLMPISENDALFTLIGTTYGGDGEETFGLPDLQGRLPVQMGQGPGISNSYQLGEKLGVESVTITVQQMAAHNHAFLASTNLSNQNNANNAVIGQSTKVDIFTDINPVNPMNANSLVPVGGSQPHDNMMPYLCISFIISLYGVFPSQT